MLAGEVSQARMYQSKLTEAEVAAVADAPSAAGPKSDDLVLWLNFDPKNIVQTGTHTTEWAEISGAPASLAYKAEIPGKSAIQATVEFSKDGKTVSGSKAFDLKSGENTIDLTGAGEGKAVEQSKDCILQNSHANAFLKQILMNTSIFARKRKPQTDRRKVPHRVIRDFFAGQKKS